MVNLVGEVYLPSTFWKVLGIPPCGSFAIEGTASNSNTVKRQVSAHCEMEITSAYTPLRQAQSVGINQLNALKSVI